MNLLKTTLAAAAVICALSIVLYAGEPIAPGKPAAPPEAQPPAQPGNPTPPIPPPGVPKPPDAPGPVPPVPPPAPAGDQIKDAEGLRKMEEWRTKERAAIERFIFVSKELEAENLYGDFADMNNLLPEIFAETGAAGVENLMSQFNNPKTGMAARIAVARVTGRFVPAGAEAGGEHFRWWQAEREKDPKEILAAEAKRLTDLLNSSEIDKIRSAAFAMQFVNHPGVIAKLRELLSSKDQIVRHRAVTALAALKAPGALDDIIAKELASEKPPVGTAAALAVGALGNAGNIPYLIKLLASADSEIKISAAAALLNLGDNSGVEALKEIVKFKNEKPELRTWAVRVLASTHDESLVPFFDNALDETDEVSFREIGRGIEIVLMRTFSFYDSAAFKPKYTEKDRNTEIERRKKIIEEWRKIWKEESSVDRVERLIEDSLNDPYWGFRCAAWKELKKRAASGVEYDPFADMAKRLDQIAAVREWYRNSGNK
jgi:hypothetical protein